MIQKILGVILIIAAIIGGIYLGIWLCFIGGIIQIVEACKQNPIDAMDVALGILRLMCSGLVGWGTVFLGCGIGAALCSSDSYSSRRSRW